MKNSKIVLFLLLILSVAFARPTLIIIDASGSMEEVMTDGTVKINAAKAAANQIVQQATDEIALMVYTDCDYGGDPHSGSISVVVPFTTNKAQLTAEIAKITPMWDTPIARSLEEGMTYVSTSGKQAGIVLLTDGEETCDDTAYATQVAGTAQQHGVVIINIVGFQLDEYTEEDMREVAYAGGGNYYQADDVSSLTYSMQQAYQSASGDDIYCCGSMFVLLALAGFVVLRR